MTPRGQALLRSLQATFAAIAEHEKTQPAEADQIYAMLITHVRSSKPHALTTLDTGPVPKVG